MPDGEPLPQPGGRTTVPRSKDLGEAFPHALACLSPGDQASAWDEVRERLRVDAEAGQAS